MKDAKRVLVVEDDAGLLEKFAAFLKRADFDVDTAMTKAEAMEKVEHRTYHVVTLDIMLTDDPNDRGGVEVLKHIQELKEGTCAVVVSQSPDVRVPVEVWKDGAMAYLIKKDIRSSQDIVKQVQSAYQACKLNLFGNYSSLNAYLAYPEGTVFFEDALQTCLALGGSNNVTDALGGTLKHLLPVVRYSKQLFGLNAGLGTEVATGWLWSKALGHAVWVCIARANGKIVPPPETEPVPAPLYDAQGRGWKASVWKASKSRQDFSPSLYDMQ